MKIRPLNLLIPLILLSSMTAMVSTITVEEIDGGSKLEDIGDKMKDLFKEENNNEDIEIEDKGKRTTDKAKDEVQDIGNKIKDISKNNDNEKKDSISIVDELRELAKLKDEGILTEKEFNQMKQKLIE